VSLRLPVGDVTVLLGPTVARRRVMNRLDDAGGRCSAGHDAAVRRLGARAVEPVGERLAALRAVADRRPAVVLVDRLTDGLAAADRRAVLAGLRDVAAAGAAVLVDDVDPVAALAVADGALRVDAAGGVAVAELAYLAS
jgi:hypothetical protein